MIKATGINTYVILFILVCFRSKLFLNLAAAFARIYDIECIPAIIVVRLFSLFFNRLYVISVGIKLEFLPYLFSSDTFFKFVSKNEIRGLRIPNYNKICVILNFERKCLILLSCNLFSSPSLL